MLHVKRNVSLKPYTTFRIGGVATAFAEVSGAVELAEAIEFSDREHLPYFVMGGGSNILFSDKGFPGLVVHLIDGGLSVRNNVIAAGAGISLGKVVETARDHGLAGIETLAGIPGSFGGAIRGNAGAFGTEIGSVVKSVKAFDRLSGMVRELSREACEFSYRQSLYKKNISLIVLSAEIALTPDADPAQLRKIIEETKAKRESKHSQDALCAGSFFMNPTVTDTKLQKEFERESKTPCRNDKLPAGWLIDHVGLRGKQIGGARVSDQHPNYLVNTGTATAEDVVMLASLVKMRVRDEVGIELKEEVQLVGF